MTDTWCVLLFYFSTSDIYIKLLFVPSVCLVSIFSKKTNIIQSVWLLSTKVQFCLSLEGEDKLTLTELIFVHLIFPVKCFNLSLDRLKKSFAYFVPVFLFDIPLLR